MTLPAWLKERIGTPGRRNTSSRRCRTCKAVTLTGLDEDRCAFQAVVDPTPLTPMGEALALLGGRRTYELRTSTTGLALWLRSKRHISAHKASDKCLVVADHECNSAPLPRVKVPALSKLEVSDSDIPPF